MESFNRRVGALNKMPEQVGRFWRELADLIYVAKGMRVQEEPDLMLREVITKNHPIGVPEHEKQTWHPDVQTHFRHIFGLMRPHFADREPTYSSLLGMPDNGNHFLGRRSKEDWELTYDDYKTPPAVKEWLNIRTDLFFNVIKPGEDVMKRLESHFQACSIPYNCHCGQGITAQWVSRFLREYQLKCALCSETKTLRRDDMTFM